MQKNTLRFLTNFVLSFLLVMGVFTNVLADDDLLARGEYLVNGIMACGNCHSSRTAEGELIEGMELAGNFVIEDPVFKAYAPNITPNTEYGIGAWTDKEIIRAIRQGIRPDGQVLGPPMAFSLYRDISDNDVRAIVAYLRSIPAVEHKVPRSSYSIPLPPNWGPPVEVVPDIPRDDLVAYGEYLAGPLGHCVHCHTPLVKGQFDFTHLGAGGNLFVKPLGYSFTVLASNITQHPEFGLGKWSDDAIKKVISTGINRSDQTLLPFMGFSFYQNISDADLDAIVAYLRTIPPAIPPVAK